MSFWKQVRITDSWGDKVGSTMTDQLMVAESHRLSGGIFNGSTLDSGFWATAIAANATGNIVNSTLDLATTIDSGSSIKMHGQSLARYTGGSMNAFREVLRLGDAGTVNNIRRFGVINGNGYGVISNFTDGFFFQLSDTTFSVVARTAGNDITISSGSFNGEVDAWSVNTDYHTFEILYTNKIIEFFIDKIRVHTFTQTNSRICGTRHFKPFQENTNTGVGSVCHLYSDVISINKHGLPASQAKTDFQQGTTAGRQLKVGPGALHKITVSAITNNAVVTIYDGTTTAGKIIWSSGTMSAQTIPFVIDLNGSGATPFETGLFIAITGANCSLFTKFE